MTVVEIESLQGTMEADGRAARDESRLATVAYWLVKYRSHRPDVPKKFDEMLSSLETDDAKEVARKWFDPTHRLSPTNRFAPVAERIWRWAENVSSVSARR